MAIVCPHCQHGMSLKDAKPGRYKPKCSKCSQRFSLTIFPQPDRAPLVEKLPAEDPGATLAPSSSGAPIQPQPTANAARATVTDHTAHNLGGTDATLPPSSTPAQALPAKPTVAATVAGLEATLAPVAPSIPSKAQQTQAGFEATLAPEIGGVAATRADATMPHRASEATAGGGSAAANATRAERPAAASLPPGVPPVIGGYRVVKELGRGAMGAVYMAKQVSLDRDVALKTIQSQWASSPTFIARFTREAYAAAQLTHHNVVQIYDLGVDRDTNYFSMEFVRGESLDDVVKRNGKLAPEAAVGYVLQAARGLQFAHAHGMVHRDVKPANLMLNEQGIVKVADMGLVKVPSSSESAAEGQPEKMSAGQAKATLAAATADVTMANVAMGTPAYMAPEQSEDAASVDHRADIYSLGCTLYVLLTGRPPFEGASALEVMTKHRTEPIIRPDVVVKQIPKDLADITLKMVAKKPGERYQKLDEVIKDLERFLGIQSNEGTFTPTDEHTQTLEAAVNKFNGATFANLRTPLACGFLVLCVAAFAVLLLVNWPLAGGSLGLAVLTTLFYFVLSGMRERTYLYDKARELVLLARWSDWLTWAGGGLIFLLALWLLNLLVPWIGMAVLAIGLAATMYFVIDRRIVREREEPLHQAEQLLKMLRSKGLDETALRQFVAKYSGDHWEEFYEALFGYEAKLVAREQFGRSDQGRRRSKFRAWREPLIRWIDGRLRADREARDRKHLQQVEEKGLAAQGVDPMQARREAQRMAEAIVDDAAEARSSAKQTVVTPADPAQVALEKRERMKKMLAAARAGEYKSKRGNLTGTLFAPLAFALGGKVRFLLGCMLIVGCAMWAKQNGMLSSEKLQQVSAAAQESLKNKNVGELTESVKVDVPATAKPLAIPIIGRFFDGYGPGIAGLLLVFLGFFRGWKMSLFALPAAAVIVLNLIGTPLFSIGTGLAIGVAGFLFGRSSDS